jgi:hypothetical protein
MTIPIWQRSFIESHLMSQHGPTRIAACRTAWVHGFDVDEIVELSGLPLWRVQQAILGKSPGTMKGD